MQREVNGYGMWVEDQGQGLPLVLIHAFPLDHHVWKDVRASLAQSHRVVLYDIRGFGRSTSTPPPYSIATLSEDLRALLDSLEIEQAVIGGISMGGYIAFSLLASHPERVLGLALVDTRASADTAEGRRARDEMADVARNEGTAAIVKDMVPKLLSDAARSERPDLVARVHEIGTQASVDGVVGALAAMRDRPDSFAQLPKIQVPTLVLVGSEDGLTPPSDAEAMAAQIPDAVLRVVPRTGHLSPMERPDEVTAALRELLARCT